MNICITMLMDTRDLAHTCESGRRGRARVEVGGGAERALGVGEAARECACGARSLFDASGSPRCGSHRWDHPATGLFRDPCKI
jgi:hypothetical protein